MRPLKRSLLAIAALGVSSAVAIPTAQAAPAPSWRIVKTNTAKTVGTDANALHDIVALGPKNAWAVGNMEKGGQSWSLAQHWNGRKWENTKLPVPFNRNSALQRVAASGPSNVWAFGDEGNSYPRALRWNGRKWAIAHRWGNNNARITDALVLSPQNVWVFGGGNDASNALGTWHFDGRSWTRVATPGFRIISASAVGPKNIWAVVSKSTTGTNDARFVARYDGRKWSIFPSPKLPSFQGIPAELNAVAAKSANEVWVVGGYWTSANMVRPVALRWNGTAWARYNGPTGRHQLAELNSVTPDGHGGIWAVRGSGYAGDILRFTGGTWSAARLPKVSGKFLGVNQLARTPGSAALWAVGQLAWGGYPATNGVVLKYG